jgi:hypothetical protein
MGQVSIVGWVAINRKARIALDVGDDPYFFNNSSLPDTRSEVALPLIARGRLLGVLDVPNRLALNADDHDDQCHFRTLVERFDHVRGQFDGEFNISAIIHQLRPHTDMSASHLFVSFQTGNQHCVLFAQATLTVSLLAFSKNSLAQA